MEIIKYFTKYPKKIKDLINFFWNIWKISLLINNKYLLTHGYALPFIKIKPTGQIIIKDKFEVIRNRELKLKQRNKDIINIFGHIA